ncbi:SpoIIIAC/SpoIIIAD family protein [Paenibacillus sp. D2_2]|uniref:SpoIIIAC/SpoIIIAD family protein n=1 Tax=Paenibacillus sp. D2_2 TaxID=3073092 RepID=UPI0035C02AD2
MIQIVGIGLLATVLILVIKEQKPMFAFLIGASTGIYIFLYLIGKIGGIIDVLEQLAASSGVQMIYLKTILKIIGIAYIAEFGAQIVRDAGRRALLQR